MQGREPARTAAPGGALITAPPAAGRVGAEPGVGPRVSTSNPEARNILRMGWRSRERTDACVRLPVGVSAPRGRHAARKLEASGPSQPPARSRTLWRPVGGASPVTSHPVSILRPLLRPYIRLLRAFALAQVNEGVGRGRSAAVAGAQG